MSTKIILVFGILCGSFLVGCNKSSDSSSDNGGQPTDQKQTEDAPASIDSPNGAAVNFPPGSVAISIGTHIFSEKAAPLKEQGVLDDLPGETKPEIVSGGDPLLVVPSREVEVISAFTIALQTIESVGLNLTDNNAIAVLYKTVSGTTFTSGIIPSSELTFEGEKISFATKEFGSYQVVLLAEAITERMQAESKIKSIWTADYENLVDADGLGKPIVSLKPVARTYPLEPTAPYRHFVNSSNAANFPVGGRCSEEGAAILVAGAFQVTATCSNFAWSAGGVDLTGNADGELVVTLKMSAEDERSDDTSVTVLKDTAAPTLTASETNPYTYDGDQDTLNFATSGEVAQLATNQTSGPGTLTASVQSNQGGNVSLRIKVSAPGTYTLDVSVFDLAENVKTLTSTIVSKIADIALTPQNPNSFTIFYSPGETSVVYSIASPDTYDQNSQGFGGYLIVRRAGSPVVFSPEDGKNYDSGKFADPKTKIIVNAAYPTGQLDSGLVYGQTYYYKAFMFNTKTQYASGVAAQVTIQALTNSQIGATGGFYQDVFVANDKLYAAKDKRGLDIFDISTGHEAAPLLLGSIDLEDRAIKVVVEGSYAYVLLEQVGFAIVDISTPASPQLVKTIKPKNFATTYYGLKVENGYAYLGLFSELYVYDVDPVATTAKVGELSGVYRASGMVIDGNTLYAAAGDSVQSINITNKTAPAVVGAFTVGAYNFSSVIKDGNDLYAGFTAVGNDGVVKIDTTDLSTAGVYYTPADTLGSGVNLVKKGSSLIFSMGVAGVYSSNLTPAENSTGVAYNSDGEAKAVAVNGNYVYIADNRNGLVVVDASSEATALTHASTVATLANTEDVGVAGNSAYLADGLNGVVIYDVLSKTAPVFQSRFKVPNGYAYSVAQRDNTIYAAFDDEGVYAIDVSDPALPTQANVKSDIDDVKHVTLAGNNVLASVNNGVGGGGLYVLDASLAQVSAVTTFAVRQSVYDGSRYAYTIAGTNGGHEILRVIDLVMPASPNVIANFDLGLENATALTYANGRIFVVHHDSSVGGGGLNKLQIVSVANPSAPSVLSSIALGASPKSVKVSGDFVYVALGSDGVAMINISDIAQPFAYGTMKVSYDAKGLFVSDNHVFVADGDDGMTIHDKVN